MFATKLDDLSTIIGTHLEERINSHKLLVTSTHTTRHLLTHPIPCQTITNVLKREK